MINLLSILAVGFFLGMRHATDADHVIAVTTIVSRQSSVRRAALTGVVWGLGHTLTILAVGSAIILFGLVIPPRIGLTMEFSVGLMLIVLGTLNLRGVLRVAETFSPEQKVHSHAHSHGDYVHTHAHAHEPEAHPHSLEQTPLARLDRALGRVSFYPFLRPLAIGVVHGLAGSAAVALLVLTTIRNPAWAVFYLLVFGLGTIAGMTLITAAIAVPFSYGTRSSPLIRGLAAASGLISLGFGLFLTYRAGIIDGLFSAAVQWTPR
jgi:high-affinity nickel permease